MTEYLELVRRVPAEPDDPAFAAMRAEVEGERPVGPGEIREVDCEWHEYHTVVTDVDGVPLGTNVHRVPSVGGVIRRMTAEEKAEAEGGTP